MTIKKRLAILDSKLDQCEQNVVPCLVSLRMQRYYWRDTSDIRQPKENKQTQAGGPLKLLLVLASSIGLSACSSMTIYAEAQPFYSTETGLYFGNVDREQDFQSPLDETGFGGRAAIGVEVRRDRYMGFCEASHTSFFNRDPEIVLNTVGCGGRVYLFGTQ